MAAAPGPPFLCSSAAQISSILSRPLRHPALSSPPPPPLSAVIVVRRAVYYREHAAGMYGTLPYAM